MDIPNFPSMNQQKSIEPVSKGKHTGKLKMSNESIVNFAGRRISKSVKFMEGKVKISKLSVAEVEEIQELAKANEGDEEKGMEVLRKVLALAVEGGEDLTDEQFDGFPIEELSKLSSEIMKFSGMGKEEKGK